MRAWLTALGTEFTRLMAPSHPARYVMMAALTLLILQGVHRISRGRLRRYLQRQAHRNSNADAFLRGYDGTWKAVKACLVLVAAGGSFRWLGLTVGLLGTMLGWSLQVPIRGLAAWVMVVLKRPFRLGDRVTVAGVTGDVIDIQLNHIILNQVGGTVQGEERSGRGVFVPNAMLFNEIILNYNYLAQQSEESGDGTCRYLLDEVLVRTSFSSDQEEARRLCIEAAATAVRELIGEIAEAPFVRSELMPWGLLLRVRYQTTPAKRQETSSRVTELIWQAFLANRPRVDFCFPGHVTRVVPRPGRQLPPTARETPGEPST